MLRPVSQCCCARVESRASSGFSDWYVMQDTARERDDLIEDSRVASGRRHRIGAIRREAGPADWRERLLRAGSGLGDPDDERGRLMLAQPRLAAREPGPALWSPLTAAEPRADPTPRKPEHGPARERTTGRFDRRGGELSRSAQDGVAASVSCLVSSTCSSTAGSQRSARACVPHRPHR